MRRPVLTLLVGALALGLTAGPASAAPSTSTDATASAAEDRIVGAASTKSLKARYGTFKTKTYKGKGDDIIKLPKAAKRAMVTITAKGKGHFSAVLKNADGETTGSLKLWEELPYKGTTAYRLDKFQAVPRYLEIKGAKSWTVKIQPLHKAKKLPKKGTTDGIYRLTQSKSKRWSFNYRGTRNFIVWAHGAKEKSQLLANEIGRWKGKSVTKKFSGIVEVRATGKWTIKR